MPRSIPLSNNIKWQAGAAAVIVVVSLTVIVSSILSPEDDMDELAQKPLVNEGVVTVNDGPTEEAINQSSASSYGEQDLSVLPESLKGTELRFRLATDEDGNLRVSSDLKDIFDYFLSAIVDEDIGLLITRIERYLASQLEGPALAQAKAVLDNYVGMKEALYHYELEQSERLGLDSAYDVPGLSILERQLRDRNEIRQRYLNKEVYESFYEQEEAYDAYNLQRLRIEQDDSLSDEARGAQLAALEANAPGFVKEARADSEKIESLRLQTRTIVENGGDIEAVNTLRSDMYGTEAVERFKALDQERVQWQARIAEYLAKKQELLDMQGLSESDKTVLVDQLRAQMFSDREQIRVRVLERKA